ncbi:MULTISPECIES: helix-turn-helix domain-containing protein [Brachybacterium]|nr:MULTISPECIES: helix-turn-helix domain-containing protein [Brachybacterium]
MVQHAEPTPSQGGRAGAALARVHRRASGRGAHCAAARRGRAPLPLAARAPVHRADGHPLHGYVEAQRMEAAARLLEMTPDPVAEIARRVVFADPLYFSRRSRALRGLSPSAHRARHGTS